MHQNRRSSIRPHDLTGETLISFESDVTHGRFIEICCKKTSAIRSAKIFVRFVESAIFFVSEGMGVAIIDELPQALTQANTATPSRVATSPA